MKLLLARGALVDGRPRNDFPPLMYAAGNNRNLEAAKLLIESGANVNFKSHNGYTALMSCVIEDADKVARLLLEQGADVNARFKPTGDTPLLHAIKEKESGDLRLFDLLLEYNSELVFRHTSMTWSVPSKNS